jgi:hypothetical protein
MATWISGDQVRQSSDRRFSLSIDSDITFARRQSFCALLLSKEFMDAGLDNLLDGLYDLISEYLLTGRIGENGVVGVAVFDKSRDLIACMPSPFPCRLKS